MSDINLGDLEKLEADLLGGSGQSPRKLEAHLEGLLHAGFGVIFLRHAANRFQAADTEIRAGQEAGRMPKRKVLPADYVGRRAPV